MVWYRSNLIKFNAIQVYYKYNIIGTFSKLKNYEVFKKTKSVLLLKKKWFKVKFFTFINYVYLNNVFLKIVWVYKRFLSNEFLINLSSTNFLLPKLSKGLISKIFFSYNVSKVVLGLLLKFNTSFSSRLVGVTRLNSYCFNILTNPLNFKFKTNFQSKGALIQDASKPFLLYSSTGGVTAMNLHHTLVTINKTWRSVIVLLILNIITGIKLICY